MAKKKPSYKNARPKKNKRVSLIEEKTRAMLAAFPADMRAALDSLGAYVVQSITVCRIPLASLVAEVVRHLSKDGSRRYYHLFMVLELTYGGRTRYLRIDKNEIVTVAEVESVSDVLQENKQTESINVNCLSMGSPVNFSQSIENLMVSAVEEGTESSLFIYDATSCNCQDFVMRYLSSNGWLEDSARSWIWQDVSKDFSPATAKVMKTVTDTAAFFHSGFDSLARKTGLFKLKKKKGSKKKGTKKKDKKKVKGQKWKAKSILRRK
jgi:hypothetical protein